MTGISETTVETESVLDDKTFDKFKILFNNTSDGIYLFDENGRFVDYNKVAEMICGYAKHELIGQTLFESGLLFENQFSIVSKIFSKNNVGKSSGPDELTIITKRGEQIPVVIHTFPINIEKKRFIIGIARDISKRKKAEEEKILAQQDMINTLKRIPGHVFRITREDDGEFIFILSEGTIASFNNLTTESIKGLKLKDISSEESFESIKSFYEKAFNGEEISFEIPLRNSWYRTYLLPFKVNEHNKVIEIIGYSIDITEHKKATEKIKENEKFFNDVFNSISDGISILDKDLNIIQTNKIMEKMYHHNFPFHGKKCFAVYQNRSIPCENCPSLKAIETKRTQSCIVPYPDSENPSGWIDLSSYPIIDMNGSATGVIEYVKDITERKKVELELISQTKRLKNILSGTNAGTWEWNIQTGETIFNEQWAKMIGYTLEEISPTSYETWKRFVHPDDFQKSTDLINKHIQGEIDQYECECRMKHKDGHWIWVLDRGKVISRTENGKPFWMFGIHIDISERKKMDDELNKAHLELKQLNDNLEEKVIERTNQVNILLKQKDEFVNQLGHDLKNPLGPLLNLLPILEKTETDGKKQQMFKVINRNVEYMRNLVNKILQLAQLKSPNTNLYYESFHLKGEVQEIIKTNILMFEEHHITIDNQLSDELILNADKLKIHEVFTNIFNNAVKYSKNDGGHIVINQSHDNEGLVTISIKDEGIGMDQHQLDIIFDEFYKADSSRHDFQNSGLGLSIAKRIVELHGGQIWAESKGPDKGSTFYFTLPTST